MDIKAVSKLANLTLTSEEEKKIGKELNKIVEYIDMLSEVDTSSVTETSQTTELKNVFREDVVKPGKGLSVDEAVSNGQQIHNNYFVVRRLIDEES